MATDTAHPTLADDYLAEVRLRSRWRVEPGKSADGPFEDLFADLRATEAAAANLIRERQAALEGQWTERANSFLQQMREQRGPGQSDEAVTTIRVGLIDTHVVNAVSYVFDDGSALILVNDALVVLAYEMCRVLVSQVNLNDDESNVSRDDAVAAITELADWMRLASVPQSVELELDKSRMFVAGALAFAIEWFLLGHEVAHIALGHHQGCLGARSLLIEVAEVPPVSTAGRGASPTELQDEERMADLVAMVHLVQTLAGPGWPLRDPVIGCAAVCTFLRFLARLEDAVRSQQFPAVFVTLNEATHPLAEERTASMELIVKEFVADGEDVWQAIAGIADTWTKLLGEVGNALERDTRADALLGAWLAENSGDVVPNYVGLDAVLAARPTQHLLPAVLASAAQRLVDFERTWDTATKAGPEGPNVAAFAAAFTEAKLILHLESRMDRGMKVAWAAMYRRYGGRAFDPRLSEIAPTD